MGGTTMARGRGGNAGKGSSWVRKDLRWAIYLRDEFRCLYCGIHMTQCVMTLDHLKSRSRGGSNKADNLVTCCQPCNARKKDRTPRSWYADLRKKGWPEHCTGHPPLSGCGESEADRVRIAIRGFDTHSTERQNEIQRCPMADLGHP